MQSSSPAVISRLPNKDANRKIIQRFQNEIHPPHFQPLDGQSMVIPERYCTYKLSKDRCEEFLLWDSGIDDAGRILVLGRGSNKNWSTLLVYMLTEHSACRRHCCPKSSYYRGGFFLKKKVLQILVNWNTHL